MQGHLFGEQDNSLESFQARSSHQGRLIHQTAWDLLDAAGFSLETEHYELKAVGVEINLVVRDQRGNKWFCEVTGAYGSKRPGLDRTDTVRKIAGSAQILARWRFTPFLIITTSLPRPGYRGDRMLRACGPEVIFDVIQLSGRADQARLNEYARVGPEAGPLSGWWTDDEIHDHFRPPYEKPQGRPGRRRGDQSKIVLDEPGSEVLPHCLKVLVPSRDREGRTISRGVRGTLIDDLYKWCGDRNGGLVHHPADGSWIQDGAVWDERLTTVETWSDRPHTLQELKPFLDRMFKDLDQEAVTVILNGQMTIVSRAFSDRLATDGPPVSR